MNTKIKSVLAAASLLALSGATANAQLLLNSITSTFYNVVPAGTASVVNGAANNQTSIATPFTSSIFTIVTTPNNFGTVFSNGVTKNIDSWTLNRTPGSLTGLATDFDFKLDFDFAGGVAVDFSAVYHVTLSQVTSSITSYSITPNGAMFGSFSIGSNNYSTIMLSNGLTGSLDASSSASNATAGFDLQVNLIAVPEPSTYALFGVVALLGMVAVRRFRSTKSVVA